MEKGSVRARGQVVRRLVSFALTGALLAGLLLAVAPGAAPAAASGLIEEGPPLPAVIGRTDGEVRASWGAPRYIKVAPHDGDRRYAYFTLREWEQLGMLYPGTQGEDVYVAPALGLQLHIRYQPVFNAQDRFSPQFRATTVTYVFDEPTPLSRVAELLPYGQGALGFDQAHWYRALATGGGRTVLAHWAAYEHEAAAKVVPFRADPPVTLYWEVGLSVPAATVDGDTPINYVIERLDQFHYQGSELEPISNPLSGM